MVHLYKSLLNTSRFGFKRGVIEDSLNNSISNLGLIFKSILLGEIFRDIIRKNESDTLGLMLPNTVPTAIVFFAIQYLNKTAAILNFTSGSKNILSCIKASKINYVITSKKFIDQSNLDKLLDILKSDTEIIFLEDVRSKVKVRHKIKSLFNFFENIIFFKQKSRTDNVAVILYTSGTESDPKAVGLTHQNLFANRMQVLEALKINKYEKFFTCLPFFHSFGLGIGVLLPILSGCKVYLYPTPLHFEKIPLLLEKTKSTVFFSTDTFLKKYLPFVSKSTFKNLNYLIAGAEKVDVSTHEKYKEHGVQILEGYGVTEASPAISVNTYDNYKIGSVGKFIPGIEYKLEKLDGYDNGGLLYIKGKNIISNYLGRTETFDWYNTGDIVNVDEDGYLFIIGRLKRFAKIAGEMISLSQVEEFPKKIWPENNSAICSVRNPKKGESLVLLTDNKSANLKLVIDSMRSAGLSNLYIPKELKIIDEFPILGSGKLDLKKLQEIAES